MRKTGDKALVMDMESDNIFMMMNLDQYEGMVGVTAPSNDNNDPEDTNQTPSDLQPEVTVLDPEPLAITIPNEEDTFDDYVLDDIISTEHKPADESSEEEVSGEEDEAVESVSEESVAEADVRGDSTVVDDPEQEIEPAHDSAKNEPITVVPLRNDGKTGSLDFSEPWNASEKTALNDEESLADVPNDGEEEKFYLEPVE